MPNARIAPVLGSLVVLAGREERVLPGTVFVRGSLADAMDRAREVEDQARWNAAIQQTRDDSLRHGLAVLALRWSDRGGPGVSYQVFRDGARC